MSEEITENVSEDTVEQAPAKKYATVDEDGTIKVDLRGLPQEEEAVETEPQQVNAEEPAEASEPVQSDQPVLEEVTEEETVEEVTEELHNEVEEAVAEAEEKGIELPENIQKVVDFMSETGGTLEDYVRLNKDYSQINEDQLLREYYEAKYTSYDKEDIDFLLADKFDYDEDVDDDADIRRKKIARKEALSEAKDYLDGLKSKYYDEIKMGSRLSPEQQKAVEFFNRYNKESEEAAKVAEKQKSRFVQESNKVFSDNFRGFDYKVGEKTYRFNVKDVDGVKAAQGDINNFIKKFLNDKGEMSDAKGYHKSLFTAMNADQVAQHFYEQGKADALKDSMARSKNVDMGTRGVHEEVAASNGWSVRAVNDGQTSSKLKVKFRN